MSFLNSIKESRATLFILLFVAALILVSAPDLAFADSTTGGDEASKYNFVPSDEVKKGFSQSYSGIWVMIAEGALWGSVIWLLVSILFLKGKLWFISPLVFLVAFFAKPAVEGGLKKVVGDINDVQAVEHIQIAHTSHEMRFVKAHLDGLA